MALKYSNIRTGGWQLLLFPLQFKAAEKSEISELSAQSHHPHGEWRCVCSSSSTSHRDSGSNSEVGCRSDRNQRIWGRLLLHRRENYHSEEHAKAIMERRKEGSRMKKRNKWVNIDEKNEKKSLEEKIRKQKDRRTKPGERFRDQREGRQSGITVRDRLEKDE